MKIFEKDIKLLIQRIHALEAMTTIEIQPEDLGSSSKESVPIPDELTQLKQKEIEELDWSRLSQAKKDLT